MENDFDTTQESLTEATQKLEDAEKKAQDVGI
jgi:hypothetical protein